MSEDETKALQNYVDAAAVFQGLSIRQEWRPEVIAHLTAIKAAADLVASFPLDDEVEAAAIFTP